MGLNILSKIHKSCEIDQYYYSTNWLKTVFGIGSYYRTGNLDKPTPLVYLMYTQHVLLMSMQKYQLHNNLGSIKI